MLLSELLDEEIRKDKATITKNTSDYNAQCSKKVKHRSYNIMCNLVIIIINHVTLYNTYVAHIYTHKMHYCQTTHARLLLCSVLYMYMCISILECCQMQLSSLYIPKDALMQELEKLNMQLGGFGAH